LNSSSPDRPVVASYCVTFLKPEMLHIYRQISSLRKVRPIVITQKRENTTQFPFEPVYIVPKPATHFFRRFWFRQLLKQPWQISRMELDALRGVLEKTGAQLLHIYFGHIAVHLLPLIRAWPHPVVVSFHGADVLVDLDKPSYRKATEEMLQLVRGIFVRSESLGAALRPLTTDDRKVAVTRTGIPIHDFPFRARTTPESGQWRLLQAGRLIEKKGIVTSLRAFAEFAKVFPNAQFTVAGEGPLLEELQRMTNELGIDGKVSFPGFVDQEKLRDLLMKSHIFLHPSQIGADGNQEGVPNSVLEAMASGLPVFATRHGGIPEAVDDGLTGMLVDERDHVALAQRLIDAARQPDLLARLGAAGSKSIAERFDQGIQAQNLEALYLKIIQETAGGSSGGRA